MEKIKEAKKRKEQGVIYTKIAVDNLGRITSYEINSKRPKRLAESANLLLSKNRNLGIVPPQHMFEVATEQRKLPNGNSFFLPSVSLDLSNTLDLTETEQDNFGDFMSWVQNYNEYIIDAWTDRSHAKEELGSDILDDIVDIEEDDIPI